VNRAWRKIGENPPGRLLHQENHPGACEVVEQLRVTPGKDIWLFGGGSLFASLVEAALVDTLK
jgi:dihydrofolate reductase